MEYSQEVKEMVHTKIKDGHFIEIIGKQGWTIVHFLKYAYIWQVTKNTEEDEFLDVEEKKEESLVYENPLEYNTKKKIEVHEAAAAYDDTFTVWWAGEGERKREGEGEES